MKILVVCSLEIFFENLQQITMTSNWNLDLVKKFDISSATDVYAYGVVRKKYSQHQAVTNLSELIR